MKRNFNELYNKLKPETKERVTARSADLLRSMALADLRRAQARTQQQLASALSVNQAWISRVERQTDMYLSTLRGYIEALGGQLEVAARFDNCVVRLDHFADLESATNEMPEAPHGQGIGTEPASLPAFAIAPEQDIDTALIFRRPLPVTMRLYGGQMYPSRPSVKKLTRLRHAPANMTGPVSMHGVEELFSAEEGDRVTDAA